MAPGPPKPGGKPTNDLKKRKDPPQDSSSAKPSSGDNRGPNGHNGNSGGGRGGGGGGGGGGGRFHKRAKVFDARSLRTQPADAALKDGELDLQAFLAAREFEIKALTGGMRASKNVNNRRAFQLVPRGLRRRTASHNVKKLPKRLRPRARREQIEDNTPTVEARRRKPKTTRARIRMEMAKKAGVVAEKKRRRRLRAAKEEAGEAGGGEDKGEEVSAAMKQLIDTRPTRPKIRRNMLNNPLKPKAKFRKRQIDKTWLPTHLWHAKRATMTPPKEPLWRFAIPLTPTEKVYRPTHRALNIKGAITWDMSYMSTIGLYGHAAGIERTLMALGMSHESLWDDRGKKWREGRRRWSGLLSKQREGVRRQIGPATVIWNPEAWACAPQASGETTAPTDKAQRQVYIRLHPACFLEVFDLLVKLIKRETPRLYIEDLRFEIGSIELTGPGATEALLGIIRPYWQGEDADEAHARLFQSLAGVATATNLAPDAVFGFSAQDPRLCYPPRTVQAEANANNAPTTQSDKASTDEPPSPFLLFDRDARFKASRFPSQKELNRRKGTNPPGQPLSVTDADPPFPLVLFSSRTRVCAQGTWTLLAPWKCILPIWYSLAHYPLSTGGNPRIGGLNELRQVAFEQGLPWFPGDFPGTDAGVEWELEQRRKRKAHWEKRPKSKRVAWESLDLGAGRKGEVGLGWACEFERLFGLQQSEQPSTDNSREAVQKDTGASAGEKYQGMDVDDNEEGGASLQKPQADSGKAKASKETAPHPLALVHRMSKTTFNALVTSKTTDPPPAYSLATVKILFPGRGVVEPCARIYRLPTRNTAPPSLPSTQPEVPATHPPAQPRIVPAELREQWLTRFPGTTTNRVPPSRGPSQPIRFPPDADHDAQKLLLAKALMTQKIPFPPEKSTACSNHDHPLVPSEEDLIGYVTKGEFNLAEGKGVAIGSVSVDKVLEALKEGGVKEGRVCIVRNAGEAVGWVGRWEVM